MGNWWQNTCIPHVMKYTIKWESNGKIASILWEIYEYRFPRFSPWSDFVWIKTKSIHGDWFCWIDGFCWIFYCTMENWWGNPCISHMMKYTIRLVSNGKKHPYYGKSMSTNFSGSPYTMGFVVFFVVWEIDGKPMHFPNDGVCHRIGV